MIEEEKHRHNCWIRTIGIVLATLIGAFLAFYFAVDMALNRMMSPEYHLKQMEKVMKNQERSFHRFENKILDNPFEPKMAPMLVNLVKENNEYKVIVDLKPLDGDEKNINVNIDNNIVTIKGEIDNKNRHEEKIMNFSQAFYLDEKLMTNRISKEKKGNKYIVTIPFED